jgi:hypothetical protein
MKVIIFSSFLTLGLIFLFIAGFSTKAKGFQLAFFLGAIFLTLAFYLR